MDNYYLKSTPKTPYINFNSETGFFEISGRSIPENSIEFYKPLITWLENYINDPQERTTVTVKLEYFNTSSSKCLVEVFRKLEKIEKGKHRVKILWFYEEEDEDMMESGEDFKEIIKLPIDLLVIEEST
jgi:hypothetical protein